MSKLGAGVDWNKLTDAEEEAWRLRFAEEALLGDARSRFDKAIEYFADTWFLWVFIAIMLAIVFL